MEANETPNLNLTVGTKDMETLKPAEVEIKEVNTEEVSFEKGQKGTKLICSVKHPDKEELIKISSVLHIVNGNVKKPGLWIMKDKEGNLQKGSGLAVLMQKFGANNVGELVGKKVPTELDKNNYLTIKAY